MIVVDTNVTVYLFAEGLSVGEVRDLLEIDPEWAVPPLWRSEFLNAMLGYVRQGHFPWQDAVMHYQDAADVVRVEAAPSAERVLELAVQNDLSAYDATYAALARELDVRHVTYDRQVIRAGLGVPPADLLGR